MSAGFTPGPWAADGNGWEVRADYGAMKVCDIRGWGYLTGKGAGALGLPDSEAVAIQTANANLIAAAPALYEALEAARVIIVEDANACRAFRDESEGPSGPENVLAKIDAVLKQARGDLVDPLEQVRL